MKIDPNTSVDTQVEYVLCENGKVIIHTGEETSVDDLAGENNSLREFCRKLDPNLCYISALIPEDKDKDVFFRARDAAALDGIHMQSTIDTSEAQRHRWEVYLAMKKLK